MQDLTFGEQVKIILGRKGMTIKQLAELIEEKTGKKMSRQNLTQRLGRDNFQEQDMRMIAEMLECPFHLSIMSAEGAGEVRSIAALERAAAARVEAVEASGYKEPTAKEQADEEYAEPEEKLIEETVPDTEGLETPGEEISNDRDMTIGELYEIHEELNELEKNVQAGESIEEIKKELEKPKKERRLGSFFRRRDSQPKAEKVVSEKENEARQDVVRESGIQEKAGWNDTDDAERTGAVGQDEQAAVRTGAEWAEQTAVQTEAGWAEQTTVQAEAGWTEQTAESEKTYAADADKDDFEPVITHDDAEEDTETGDVNPYTGKEYQSNSVRMHPTRIGYVQVYDRTIHKWTDMTEWAFLGLQERKKALLGKAYEPPIYLD